MNIREEIENIIRSTWSSTFYQGGQEFTTSGVQTERAAKLIMNIVSSELKKKIEGLYASEAKDVIDQEYESNYCRFRNEALGDVLSLLQEEEEGK